MKKHYVIIANVLVALLLFVTMLRLDRTYAPHSKSSQVDSVQVPKKALSSLTRLSCDRQRFLDHSTSSLLRESPHV